MVTARPNMSGGERDGQAGYQYGVVQEEQGQGCAQHGQQRSDGGVGRRLR